MSTATLGATAARSGLFATRAARNSAVGLGVVALLLLVGVQAYGPVFGGSSGYVAAGGGVAVGLVLAVVSAYRGWTFLGTLVVGMLAYLVLGGPFALRGDTLFGVVPSVETLQRLVLLSWQAWRDLLTVSLPAGQFDGPAVLPFLTGLLAASLAGSCALRLRRAPWALLPTFAFLVVGILWGSQQAPLAALQGFVFAAAALAWVAWRAQSSGEEHAHAVFVGTREVRSSRLHRVALAAGVLGVAGAVGAGAVAAVGTDGPRHVLRDEIVPPLDLRAYPSPLTLFRSYETNADDVLFTVSGLPAGARVRLAALDVYDGNVYSVSESSARFGRAGSTIVPSASSTTDRETTEATFQIEGYSGVWLPGGGDLRGVDFDDPRARTEAAGLFYNPATGTALSTAGLRQGSTYTAQVVLPEPLDADAKAELPSSAVPGTVATAGSTTQVDAVVAATSDLIGDSATPLDQLRTIEATLRTDGFFADGDPFPSLAGHTTERIRQLLESATGQMVGDDEQYAVAMTLMAEQLGLPARVVMGFYPKDPAASAGSWTVTGDDAHVWTEVLFEDLGWVPFDPTPDDSKTPDQITPTPQERNDPQVLPPPEVPQKRELKAPPKADSDQTERKPDEKGGLPGWVRYAVAAAGGAAALSLPFWLVLALKARRRGRRRTRGRTADRISGGWAEVADTATDLGTPLPALATRLESARSLRASYPDLETEALARRVDAFVFGEAEPHDEAVRDVWTDVDSARAQLLAAVPLRRRLRARFSVRSLRRPSDAAQRTRRIVWPLPRLARPRFSRETA